jgi:hypothetical protein
MISATAAFGSPSTASWPAVLELMVNVAVPGGTSAQPGETAYQSGSAAASTSLSIPSVRHGNLPTAGSVQFPAATPSFAPPALPGASGHGSRPGLFLPAARGALRYVADQRAFARPSVSAFVHAQRERNSRLQRVATRQTTRRLARAPSA